VSPLPSTSSPQRLPWLLLVLLVTAPALADPGPRYAWERGLAPSAEGRSSTPTPTLRLPSESAETPLGDAPGDEALAGLILRAAPDAPAQRVLLLSIDGLRPDALSASETPVLMWLMAHGLSARHARTLRRSLTLPSHASMMTGVGIVRHRLGWNSFHLSRGRSHFPSIFRVAHAAGISTALFVGKPKLSHILEPGDADTFEVGGILCDRVNARALPYLREMASGLAFVHYPDPDGAGHRDGWMSPNYHRAVRRSDRCLGEVLEALSTHGFARTLIIVTADHGGHDHTHGTSARVDRRIPWIAFGGVVRPGEVMRGVRTLDTAPTILRALGLPLPHGLEGRAIEAAFTQRRARAPCWQPVSRR